MSGADLEYARMRAEAGLEDFGPETGLDGAYLEQMGDKQRSLGLPSQLDLLLPAKLSESDSPVGQAVMGLVTEELTDPESAANAALSNTIATATDNLAPASSSLSDFIGRIRTNAADLNVLVIGDSTSTPEPGWARTLGQHLAVKYPTHTFQTRAWNGASYDAATAITPGTGARTVTVWVAARNGNMWHSYTDGQEAARLYAPSPDLVFVALGHNETNSRAEVGNMRAERDKALVHLEAFRLFWPDAAIVLLSQNPQLVTYPNASAHRADMYRRIALGRGYGFIDIERAFRLDGRPLTDLIESDNLHPNLAGQQLWRAEVLRHFIDTPQSQPTTQAPPAFQTSAAAQNIFPDPTFTAWDGGATLPGWALSNVTISPDTTNYETGTKALKLVKTTTGNANIAFTMNANLVRGKTYLFLVRLRIPAGNPATAGQAELRVTAANGTSDIWGVYDRFIWRSTLYRFPLDAANAQAKIHLDQGGTATPAEVTVDRVILIPGTFPADI